MTRALIADPELVAKVADGRADEVIACIGCNQGCIGHYHAGVPIGCLVNPRTGRERDAARRVRAARRGRDACSSSAAARRAWPRRSRRPRTATPSRCSSAAREIGGQLRLAGRAPAPPRALAPLAGRRRAAARARRRRRAAQTARPSRGDADDYELVVLATGARPYVPPWAEPAEPDPFVRDYLPGPSCSTPGRRSPNPSRRRGARCSWPTGAAAGTGSTPPRCWPSRGSRSRSPAPRRARARRSSSTSATSTSARFDERGIAHPPPHRGRAAKRLRHVFCGRESRSPDVATIVFAQGRVPDDELWPALEGRAGAIRAGDVLGPRSAEEATLEGVTAYRAAAKNV